MTSPAEDIASILEIDALGIRGTDIFIGLEPEDAGTLTITIYDTGGFPPNPKWLRDEPTVQCRVRGTAGDYTSAWAKAQAIKDALLGRAPTTVGTTDYVFFIQLGDIISLGHDDNNRPMIVSNWHLAREMPSGGNRFPL